MRNGDDYILSPRGGGSLLLKESGKAKLTEDMRGRAEGSGLKVADFLEKKKNDVV
jgi:hypothetical protein